MERSAIRDNAGRPGFRFRLRAPRFGGLARAEPAVAREASEGAGAPSGLRREVRDISLSCNRPLLWAAGAIPTLDFILCHLGAAVKKSVSRVKIGRGQKARSSHS